MIEVPPEVHILTKVLISIIEQQYFSLHPTITLVCLWDILRGMHSLFDNKYWIITIFGFCLVSRLKGEYINRNEYHTVKSITNQVRWSRSKADSFLPVILFDLRWLTSDVLFWHLRRHGKICRSFTTKMEQNSTCQACFPATRVDLKNSGMILI